MTLDKQTKQILNDFENAPSDEILTILQEIMPLLKSELTQDYLQGKINAIKNTSGEAEKKAMCKNLLPYLDWYLQGI